MADLHIHTLAVRNHRITCDSPVLVQNGMGHDAIALDLDAEWDGLSVRLVLGPCGSAYDVLYEGEPVVVPAATLAEAGWLPVSVVGYGEDGTVRVTTERCDHLLRVAALEQGTYQPSEPEGDPEWPEWVRPTSKDTQYHKGDKVTFEGVRYVCNKNNVTASPAENPKSWVRQD